MSNPVWSTKEPFYRVLLEEISNFRAFRAFIYYRFDPVLPPGFWEVRHCGLNKWDPCTNKVDCFYANNAQMSHQYLKL